MNRRNFLSSCVITSSVLVIKQAIASAHKSMWLHTWFEEDIDYFQYHPPFGENQMEYVKHTGLNVNMLSFYMLGHNPSTSHSGYPGYGYFSSNGKIYKRVANNRDCISFHTVNEYHPPQCVGFIKGVTNSFGTFARNDDYPEWQPQIIGDKLSPTNLPPKYTPIATFDSNNRYTYDGHVALFLDAYSEGIIVFDQNFDYKNVLGRHRIPWNTTKTALGAKASNYSRIIVPNHGIYLRDNS